MLPAESLAALQFGEVGEVGALGFDDVTVEALEGVGIGGEACAEICAHFGCVGDPSGVVDEVGGEEAVAAHEPVVLDEDIDEEAFDDAEGLVLAVVLVGEFLEGGGVFAGGGFVAGIDGGFQGVHARNGFALRGARTGREQCVAAIGLNLLLGCHRVSATTVAGEEGVIGGQRQEVLEGKGRNKKMLESRPGSRGARWRPVDLTVIVNHLCGARTNLPCVGYRDGSDNRLAGVTLVTFPVNQPALFGGPPEFHIARATRLS